MSRDQDVGTRDHEAVARDQEVITRANEAREQEVISRAFTGGSRNQLRVREATLVINGRGGSPVDNTITNNHVYTNNNNVINNLAHARLVGEPLSCVL